MKKFLFALVVLVGPCRALPPVLAGDVIYNGKLAEVAGLAADTNYDLDLKEISSISFVATYSSTTRSNLTFSDGKKSTATITIVSTQGVVGSHLGIHTVRLDEGTGKAWQVGRTSSDTAKAISDAIMANSTLNAIMASTWTAGGIVFATATTTGVNAYDLFTSTPAAMKINDSATSKTGTFLNGAASNINSTTDVVEIGTHRVQTGFAFWLSTGGYTTPGGLLNGTTYYVIKQNGKTAKFATSKANAVAGTAVDITTQGGGGTFTLRPCVIPATVGYGFKWQGSNDGTTFVDLSLSSITVNSTLTAGTTSWNMNDPGYRYLRLNYRAPTLGGADITVTGRGRK